MSPKNAKSPKLIIVSAPSGAGKTTLCEMLIKEFPSIELSTSMTTRPKRSYEVEGVHYHFATKEEFEKRVLAGEFAEHAQVHTNWYGTPKSEIERRLKNGKNVLFDIDVQGAMNLKKQYGDQALLVFIHPPSMEILEQRLRDRKGDSPQSIETRLQNAYNELRWSKSFNYHIINGELNRAYRELKEILKKECVV